MVETRSQKSAASRDVAAIHQSVPSVRNVVMPKRGEADGSRPTSAASSAKSTKSMPTTVSVGHATESFPMATPSPSTPRRTRACGRGTRSTPSTPPSHRRLLPRAEHSPRKAPGSGGTGFEADADADAERSIDSHVTQFAESLRALRELGLAGIHDFGDDGFREASEEQESEQMRVLLEERSRARELVRQLERDKQLQADELRLMEARVVEQEMTEEELVATEREVTRARLESASLASAKEALEHELARQMDLNARWSEKLRVAESEEATLLAAAEKAERALAEKEAEAEALARRLTAAERELDALGVADVARALRAAGAGTSAEEKKDATRAGRSGEVRRSGETSRVETPVSRGPRLGVRLVATDATPARRERGERRTERDAAAARAGPPTRRSAFFGAKKVAAAAACAACAAALGVGGVLPADARAAAVLAARSAIARSASEASARDASLAAPRAAFARFPGDETEDIVASSRGGPRPSPHASPAASAPRSAASADVEAPPRAQREADSTRLANEAVCAVGAMGAVDAGSIEPWTKPGASDLVTDFGPAAAAADGEANRLGASPASEPASEPGSEPASEPGSETAPIRGGVSATSPRALGSPQRASPAPAAETAAAAAARPKRAPSTPPLAASALARASEEAAWEATVREGWAAWRRLGGSDRRARVKAAARRAESAAAVAKEAREACAEAARRYDALLSELEATRAAQEASGDAASPAAAAERQRLTLASHEADAETAGSERKWESLREKASRATRALETELRGIALQ